VIRFAYGLDAYAKIEITGAQSRLLDEWFDIQAKPSDDQAGIDRDGVRAMTRAMLADRFKLNAQETTGTQTVSVLRRRKPDALGPNIRPFDAACTERAGSRRYDPSTLEAARTSCSVSLYEGHLVGTTDMADFASYLSTFAQAPFIDGTGLEGRFQVEMHFEIATLNPRLRVTTDFPTFTDALRQELGLTVEKETRPARWLSVQHVEPPSAN